MIGTSTTAVATTSDNSTEEHHHHQSEQQPQQHQYQPQYLSSPQQHQRHMIHSPSSVSSISSTDSPPVVATTTEQNKRSYHTAFHHSPPSSSTSQQQQLPHGGGEIRPPLPKHLMTQQQRIPIGNSHSNVPRSMPFHDTHSSASLFPPPPRRIYGSSLDHANSNSLFPLPPISALQSQVPHQQNSPTNDIVVQQPYQHDYHHHESSPEVGPPLVKRFKYAQIPPPPLAPLVRRNQQQSQQQQQQSSAPVGPSSHPPPPYHHTPPPSSHAQQSYYSQQQHASAHSYAQSQHSPPPYNHHLHHTQQQSPQMIRHGNDNKSHYHYQQQQQQQLPLPPSHIPPPYNHNKSSSHSHPSSLPSMSSSPSFYQQQQQQQQQQYSAPVSSHQQSPSQPTSNYSPQYMNNNNNSSSSHHHHHHQQHQQQQQHLSSLSNTTTKNQLYPPLVIHHANNNNNNKKQQPPPFVLSSVPEFTVPPKPVNMTRIISQNHNVSEALMALATKSSSSSSPSSHHHPHHSHNSNSNHHSNSNSSQRTKQRETTSSFYHHQQRETDASTSSSSSLKPTVASLDEISRKRSHALLAPLISTQHSSVFYRILSFISPMDAVGGILLTSKLFHMIAYHRMLFSSVSRSKNRTVEVRNNDVVAVKALQHAIRYGHVVLLQKLLTNSSISPYACYDSYHFAVIHRGERDYMAELFLRDGRMQQYLESENSAATNTSANSATSGAVMNHSNSQVHSQYSEDGSGAVNMTGERRGTDLDHHETTMTDMKSGDHHHSHHSHHHNHHGEENAEENGGDDDAFAAAVSLYRFQMPEPVESKKYFYTMKRKVPSSQSQIDVVNYLVQERLNMVMTLTKLKPNKGAKSSPTGLYWEVANMIIPDQQTTPPTPTAGMLGRASYMGADQGTLVIRSGNKGTNDNGSHNRIRYALYFRVPIDLLVAQQGVIDPTNIQFDYGQFAVMARRCDNFEYEDREKVLIDKQTMFKCLIGENQHEYFMYMALRFDISQNASKSLKHTLQVFYKNVPLVESSRCKFVSGRGNPNCILSKKSHSEERNVPCYMIKEVPTTK